MTIIPLTSPHRPEVDRYIRDEWGGPMVVSLGNLYDTSVLPGFAALDGDKLLGAVVYRVDGDECEVACIFSLVERIGVGRALLDAVIAEAKTLGCRRVWLITTNDNTKAIRFYQIYGFALRAVHIGSFAEVRRLKPGIPANGIDDIPLEHEFEFEIVL